LRLTVAMAAEPWVRATLETQWKEARRQAIAAGHTQFKGKRWHDLRGTYATRLARNPKLTISDIAGIMGWDLKTAEKVIKFYVGDDVLNDALLDKIVTGEAEMAARLVEKSEQNKT